MNVSQANDLNFPDLLSRMGMQPVSVLKNGNELWYYSPFRAEKTASFHISHLSLLRNQHKHYRYQWAWKDFGDMGGTVIDFVMRYQGHNSFKQALSYLETLYGKSIKQGSPKRVETPPLTTQPPLFSFHVQEAALPPDFSENREGAIERPAIYDYLIKERAISRPIIDRYLKEVHYRNKKTGKDFFAFGMKNRSGGYEIRAASDKYSFKSALIKRDVTLIKGCEPQRKSLNLVEGMTEQLAGDTLIMHSLSSYDRVVELIKGMGFTSVYTFLDNDEAGKKHTLKLKEEFGDKVKPKNYLFEPYKDLNAALVANQPSLK